MLEAVLLPLHMVLNYVLGQIHLCCQYEIHSESYLIFLFLPLHRPPMSSSFSSCYLFRSAFSFNKLLHAIIIGNYRVSRVVVHVSLRNKFECNSRLRNKIETSSNIQEKLLLQII
jgi:hypothetical protein